MCNKILHQRPAVQHSLSALLKSDSVGRGGSREDHSSFSQKLTYSLQEFRICCNRGAVPTRRWNSSMCFLHHLDLNAAASPLVKSALPLPGTPRYVFWPPFRITDDPLPSTTSSVLGSTERERSLQVRSASRCRPRSDLPRRRSLQDVGARAHLQCRGRFARARQQRRGRLRSSVAASVVAREGNGSWGRIAKEAARACFSGRISFRCLYRAGVLPLFCRAL